MPIYVNGTNVSLNTDDIAEGSTNLWSQFDEFSSGDNDFIRPNNNLGLYTGPTAAAAEVSEAASGLAAVFAAPTTGGLNYFVNSSVGSGFAGLGSLFFGLRARGSYGSETVCQAGDPITGFIGGAFDGNVYSTNSGGSYGLPGYYIRTVTEPASDLWDPEWLIGGFGVPIVHLIGTTSPKFGVFGATPVERVAAYTPSNVTPTRTFDANATSVAELADVVGTIIADQQSYGWFQ